MEALQSEMKDQEAAKDHQLKEVGCEQGLVHMANPAHCECCVCVWPQVAAERMALQEDYEKIQRMVRWWVGDPL